MNDEELIKSVFTVGGGRGFLVRNHIITPRIMRAMGYKVGCRDAA